MKGKYRLIDTQGFGEINHENQDIWATLIKSMFDEEPGKPQAEKIKIKEKGLSAVIIPMMVEVAGRVTEA